MKRNITPRKFENWQLEGFRNEAEYQFVWVRWCTAHEKTGRSWPEYKANYLSIKWEYDFTH